MTIPKKILWLENEIQYHKVFADDLRREGHEVRLTDRLSEAESLLRSGAYDLLILDVMIPTWDADEERKFPPHETDHGHMTGLAFYRMMKGDPELKNIPVLVYTQRLERQVFDAFKDEGLPESSFATKFECPDAEALYDKVKEISGAA